jgi:hypothetical protein
MLNGLAKLPHGEDIANVVSARLNNRVGTILGVSCDKKMN